MMQYLPYIFGTASLLGGIYLFLISFNIYRPIFKTEEQKERSIKLHKKFGTLMKIGSIFLIANGAYDLLNRDSTRYSIGTTKKVEWSSEDREILIGTCMRDASTTAKNFPKITREYCECSVDIVIENITYLEYMENLNKTTEEQVKILFPLIQDCLTEHRRRLDVEKMAK